MNINLKPSDIRYSQDSISRYFIDRTTLIGKTLDDICEGRCTISRIPMIDVIQMNSHWVTADNRRLWVFKHVERLGKCTDIQVQITGYIDSRKLTSPNNGTSVKIRGGDPGGRWYLKPTPQSHPLSSSNIYADRTRLHLTSNRFSLQNPPTRLSKTIDRKLAIESPRYGRFGTQTHETDQEQRQSPISIQQTRTNLGQHIYQRNQSEATGLHKGHSEEASAFAFKKLPTQVMGFESSGYGSRRYQTSYDFPDPQRIPEHGKTTEVNLIRQLTETYEGPKLNPNRVQKVALRHSKARQKPTVDSIETLLRYSSLRDTQTDDERIGRERQRDLVTLGTRAL